MDDNYDPAFGQFRTDSQKITQYCFVERYPLSFSLDLTEEEVRDSLNRAEEIVAKIKAGGN